MAEIKKEAPKKLQTEEDITNKEKTFSEQIDDYFAGRFNRYNDLKVCDTPAILLVLGCEQLPMLYTQRHLAESIKEKNEHTHAHGLTISQLKQMPEEIENPVMVFDSLTRSDSIIIVTSMTDSDNNPIIISVMPNGTGKYQLKKVDSNFITSIYGRENFHTHLERVIENGNMIFANKQKSQELFSVLGLQSSKGLNNLDFNIIIHQSKNIVNHFPKDFLSKESREVDKFYINERGDTLIDIYFNPDSDEGGQFVINRIPLEVVAKLSTSNSQKFFENLDIYAQQELVDITDPESFNSVKQLHDFGKALLTGRNVDTMNSLVNYARKQMSSQADSDDNYDVLKKHKHNKQNGRH